MSVENPSFFEYINQQYTVTPSTDAEVKYARQEAIMISGHPEYQGLDPEENPFIMRRLVQKSASALVNLDLDRPLSEQDTPARQIRTVIESWKIFDSTKRRVFAQTLEYYPKLLSGLISEAPVNFRHRVSIKPEEIDLMSERIPGFIKFLEEIYPQTDEY